MKLPEIYSKYPILGLKVKVKEILHHATVLHHGWEMDNLAWCVKMEDDSLVKVTTDHGILCIMSDRELLDKIKETEESLIELKALYNYK